MDTNILKEDNSRDDNVLLLVAKSKKDKAPITIAKATNIVRGWEKERGLVSNRANGVRDEFYSFIESKSRTMEEVLEFLNSKSDNVKKHTTSYLAVYSLVERVRANKK